jgi:hypothetical protein
LSIIQWLFSITKCQTLISRFATFSSLWDSWASVCSPAESTARASRHRSEGPAAVSDHTVQHSAVRRVAATGCEGGCCCGGCALLLATLRGSVASCEARSVTRWLQTWHALIALLQDYCSLVPPKPNPLRCVPFTAVTHPLSALNAPLVYTGHPKHDGGSARAGQTLGSACPAKMVKSAWAGDVRWVCSRAGCTGTSP